MKRITDKSFKYTPSHETDISKRFRKVIAEQKRNAEEAAAKVKTLIKAKA